MFYNPVKRHSHTGGISPDLPGDIGYHCLSRFDVKYWDLSSIELRTQISCGVIPGDIYMNKRGYVEKNEMPATLNPA